MIVGLKKYPLLNPAPGAAGGGLNLEPDPDDVNDLPPDDDAGGQPDPDNMTAEEKAIARGDIIPAPPPAPEPLRHPPAQPRCQLRRPRQPRPPRASHSMCPSRD